MSTTKRSVTVSVVGVSRSTTVEMAKGAGTAAVEIAALPVRIEKGTDTSGDTVTPETLMAGYTAHDSSGSAITGTLAAARGVAFGAA